MSTDIVVCAALHLIGKHVAVQFARAGSEERSGEEMCKLRESGGQTEAQIWREKVRRRKKCLELMEK